MELKSVRGMHDLFGEEMFHWIQVEEKIRRLLGSFGFQEIRMPVLERKEVFTQSIGEETDIVEKQMYQVWGSDASETLVMRPEGTASFTRSVVEHGLHHPDKPHRYFYYLPMFRHERPQKGRLRQFQQFGAELLMDGSSESDCELIVLGDHICKSFNITEYAIKLNSVGCSRCRPQYRETLKVYLKPSLNSLCPECHKRFHRSALRILDCKKEGCLKIAEKGPKITASLCAECKEHHERLKRRLTDTGVSFEEDPRIVRGLDYYCRTAFEFVSDLLGSQSALLAGGRYDGLSEKFGEKPFPAVGFALGMERFLMILEEKNALSDLAKSPLFFFAPLGEEAMGRLFRLSVELKRRAIWVEMNYERGKSLKSLMKQADRSQALWTLILGEDELKRSVAYLKDMKTGNQEEVALNALENELVRRAGVGA